MMTRKTRLRDSLVVSLWDTCPHFVELKRYTKDRKLGRMEN